MASNLIGEAILIIASVIVAGSVAGIVMSKVGLFESTVTSTSQAQQDKMLTKIKIIYASNTTDNQVKVWVKNTGRNPIVSTTNMDVFFGEIGQVQRIPYEVSTNDDTWEFYQGAPTVWPVMNTTQINIDDNDLVKDVTYLVRVTAPNGIHDEYIFSLP